MIPRMWWLLAVRGVAGVLFGILAVIWPVLTIGTLLLLFAAYAFLDGGFALLSTVDAPGPWRAWWIIEGLLGIALGVLILVQPERTVLGVCYFIGGWALLTGVVELITATRLRGVIVGEALFAGAGVVSLVFGAFMLAWPRFAVLAAAWLIGLYAFFFGLFLLAFALRLHRITHQRPLSA